WRGELRENVRARRALEPRAGGRRAAAPSPAFRGVAQETQRRPHHNPTNGKDLPCPLRPAVLRAPRKPPPATRATRRLPPPRRRRYGAGGREWGALSRLLGVHGARQAGRRGSARGDGGWVGGRCRTLH